MSNWKMNADWRFSFTTDTFNIASVPHNITTHFKDSSKVSKPNSRKQSPYHNLRRRVTTHLPSRTGPVVDHQIRAGNAQDRIYGAGIQPRPVSWHPDFAGGFSAQQPIFQHSEPQPWNASTNTAVAYGLFTPVPAPTMVESYLDCPNGPLNQMADQNMNLLHYDHQYFNTYNEYDQNINSYTPLSTSGVDTTSHQSRDMTWPMLPATGCTNFPTAPSSPAYLPIPELGRSLAETRFEEESSTEELVGLGLYDSPDQVRSANLLFNGSSPVQRKGLKLEESFEPTPEVDADEDDVEYHLAAGEDLFSLADVSRQLSESMVGNMPQPNTSSMHYYDYAPTQFLQHQTGHAVASGWI